ncbi:MAG TPA: tyrosine-type recombinase/integrase [Planctomycetota bacterium]|nr:tyrosine-type recombinase/integrase [Planctomycetota bacterium]HRR82612.1 tyrosine-type recombinase/integrase [Planctomycetota bacterium]HRT94794.1 tyrosine-type recombinase/integrase [Planctomycetota bacterium]
MGRIVQIRGRWYAEYWHPAQRRNVRKRVDGTRRQRESFLLDCQLQARREAAGLQSAATNHVEIEPLISAWRSHNAGRTRKRTWESYALGLARVLDWLEPRTRPHLVSDLRLADIEAFKAAALAGGAAPRTVAMRVGALKQMLRWALREGRIASNPLAAWQPPRGDKRTVRRALTAFEFQQLLNASPPELADVWRFFVATAMRAGEVTSLEWNDVDADNHRLRVRAEVSKSRRDRWVYYGDAVAAILAKQRLHLAERPDTETARRLVFVSPRGAAWGDRLSRKFRACREAAKLPDGLDLHCLRHTAATHLIASGADVKTVQSHLGHSSATVTLDVYAHAWEANSRRAAASLDGLAGMAIETPSARGARAAAETA